MSETDYFVSGKTGLTDSIRVCASDLSRDVCHPDKCKPLRADCSVRPFPKEEPAEILHAVSFSPANGKRGSCTLQNPKSPIRYGAGSH